MRHRKIKGRLGRRTSWRKATLKSLAKDLFKYQRIETTLAKAKALRSFAEPLITIAKNDPDSINARRRVFKRLSDEDIVRILFSVIAPLYKDIPGGYTRIMPLGTRKGDGAPLAIIELTHRTISDDKLLGKKKEKPKEKKKKAGSKTEKAEALEKKTAAEEPHSAPVADEKKGHDKRSVEDTEREKAKTEEKRITQRGFFKRFRRKSI